MDKIIVYFTILFTTSFGVYTIAIWPTSVDFNFIEHQLTQFTGIISLAFLTAVMLLAIEPNWLTNRFVNKSKCYRLHKQFGIGSGIALAMHWLTANDVELTQWLFTHNMQSFGEEIGEVTLYLLLPLIGVSLSRLFRLPIVNQIHRLGGVIFIVSAMHAVLMLESGSSQIIFSSVVFLLSIIGCTCAVVSLNRNRDNANSLYQKIKTFHKNIVRPVFIYTWRWIKTQLENAMHRKKHIG